MLKTKRKLLLTLVVVGISILSLNAQNRIHSPYSRYGLGELQQYSNSRYTAMGGLGYAERNSTSVNVLNPASYMSFDSLSFVFEGGLTSNFVTSETSFPVSLSQKSNYTSLAYMCFGFPINRWWKGSFGLLPYSSVGYNITEYQNLAHFGNVKSTFEGDGGINQFFIGQAFRINKNLSLGINISYLFGGIDRTQKVYFPDSAFTYNTKDFRSTNYGAFNFNFGLQYFKGMGKDYTLGAGLTFSNAMNASTTSDQYAYSFSETYTGTEYVHDTVTNSTQTDVSGTIHIPLNLGIGLSVEKNNKWLLGADLNLQNWANFTNNGVSEPELSNSMRISVGGEIKPDNYSSKYFKRISYRAGFHYTNVNLKINGTQINEFAVSFGLGLPLRKSKSTINLGVEYGNRGTTDNSLIKENFTKITIGFSAYDFWFFKRKYD
ncbi:MAG: hypothetical protein NTZ33_11855 [Bacteroidetes bacterium]|nr:hypothetical protein [Bacteroidota bacterium]